MRNIKKEIKPFIIMISMVVGFEMQHASPPYQLIFLGIIIIGLLYEIFKMKSSNRDDNVMAVLVSGVIFSILLFLLVMGKIHNKINDSLEGIILLIAFGQLLSTMIISGFRAGIRSGNRRQIRKVFIGSILLVVIILLYIGVILFGKYL